MKTSFLQRLVCDPIRFMKQERYEPMIDGETLPILASPAELDAHAEQIEEILVGGSCVEGI